MFPVPDGDTGANMTSTLASGIETLKGYDKSFKDIGIHFNEELNRCSRGNSGFILARFFHGFFEAIGDAGDLTSTGFLQGISNGSYHVNGALFSPVEGTMISILSALRSALLKVKPVEMSQTLKLTDTICTEALFKTPKQLPVLARAGVVDSGALGLVFIFRGMLAAFTGSEPVKEEESDYRVEPDPDSGDAEEELPE